MFKLLFIIVKKIIDYLYYQSFAEKAITVPQGQINISKLIRGNDDYYESPYSSAATLQKTLILSNWLSFRPQGRENKLVLDLLNEGFAIYHEDMNGKFYAINVQNLSHFMEVYFAFKPKEETAQNFLALHTNLTRDQVEVLDYRLFSNLLDDREKFLPEVKSIFDSDILNVMNSQHQIKTILYEMREYPNVKLVFDAITNTTKNDEEKLHKKLNNFGIKIPTAREYTSFKAAILPQDYDPSIYKQIDLSSSHIDGAGLKILLEASINLEELNLSTCLNITTLDLSDGTQFRKLEKINLSVTNIDGDGLQTLFEASPNVRDLNLSDCNDLDISNITKLHKLEKLNLSGSDIDGAGLKALLGDLHNLKDLNLDQCKNLTILDFSDIAVLSKIETLSLDYSSIDGAGLKALLAVFPNLKDLQLGNSINLAALDLSGITQLSKLEKLNIYSSIGGAGLKALLEVFPNLKDLNLCSFENLTALDLSGITKLSKLENLRISISNIDGAGLKALLEIFPNIKDLNIYDCKNLKTLDLSRTSHLSKLEKIDISCSKMDGAGLQALLEASSNNLQYLNIYDCINLKTLDLSGITKLSKLKTINISGTNIDSAGLKALLEASINVQYLNLYGCQAFATLDLSGVSQLHKLEKLGLSQTNIDNAGLKALFKILPNVQDLNLSGCQAFATLDLSGISQLHKLEKLDLACTNIDNAALKALFEIFPNLKELQIDHSRNPAVLDLSGIAWLSTLEKVTLNSTNIDGDGLKALFEVLPNLKELSLYRCKNITTLDLSGITHMPKLEKIDLGGTNIDGAGFKALLEAFPDLIECSAWWNSMDLSFLSLEMLDRLECFGIDLGTLSQVREDLILTEQQEMGEDTPGIDLSDLTQNRGFDVDTKFSPKSTLHATRAFYDLDNKPYSGIARHHARSGVFNELSVAQESVIAAHALTMKHTESTLALQTVQKGNVFQKQASQSYAKATLNNFSVTNKFRPLPSLSSKEKMVCYDSNHEVEIAYKEDENIYYIKSLHGSTKEISLEYILLLPKNIESEFNSQDAKILPLIKKYNAFGAGALKIEGSLHTGDEWASAMDNQEIGACRHRAFLFKYEMDKLYSTEYDTRIVVNAVHSFCEYKKKTDTVWKSCDLGGYHANVKMTGQQRLETSINFETVDDPNKAALPKFSIQRSLTEPEIKKINLSHLLELDGVKHLLRLNSAQEVSQAKIEIAAEVVEDGKDVFFVNSADDLICSLPFIQRNDKNSSKGAVVDDKPGGALYDFLTQNLEKQKVLIIDYSKFTASEIVKYNAILDETRSVDGVAIPKGLVIYALSNMSDPDNYDGWDFYRRFDGNIHDIDHIDDVTLAYGKINHFDPNLEDDSDSNVINLYKGSDWKNILLGKWILQQDGLVFEEGEFVKLIQQGKTNFHIKNGLWHEIEFREFWDSAFALGFIIHDGQKIEIPEGCIVKKSEGYNFSQLDEKLNFTLGYDGNHETINPTYAYLLFDGYRLEDDQMLIHNGMIHDYKDEELSINLTRALNENTWARIVDECSKYNVRLKVYLENKDLVPSWYAAPLETKVELTNTSDGKKDQIIKSKDIELSAITIKDSSAVIDISEVRVTDLIGTIDGKFNRTTGKIEFVKKGGFLAKALEKNQHIVLKGELSAETKDALSKFLLERGKEESYAGELTIISENIDDLYGAQVIKKSDDELFEGRKQFFSEYVVDDKILKESTLSKIHSIVRLGEKTFEGFDKIRSDFAQDVSSIDFTRSAAQTEQFEEARIHSINSILSKSPYVFLSGLTGVGKTAFVQDFVEKNNATLFRGMSSIKQWAKDDSKKQKILFIDEANLQNRDFTEFEGMFINNTLFIDGELIELTEFHNGIFAGNPTNYGNGRTIASLFKKHGGATIFDVLPMYFIYEKAQSNFYIFII